MAVNMEPLLPKDCLLKLLFLYGFGSYWFHFKSYKGIHTLCNLNWLSVYTTKIFPSWIYHERCMNFQVYQWNYLWIVLHRYKFMGDLLPWILQFHGNFMASRFHGMLNCFFMGQIHENTIAFSKVRISWDFYT